MFYLHIFIIFLAIKMLNNLGISIIKLLVESIQLFGQFARITFFIYINQSVTQLRWM